MNQDLFELLQLCLIASKKHPLPVDAQRTIHDGLTLVVYEEARPGFVESNRQDFELCRNTLRALTKA